ncbi:LysR substrate-binding domain-containing protein [Palleronia sp. LCG004]|uniref:LysR substrate-binding domain-containing protein n=1 Tax=Palleronia sp. LCG004 TaxID=3079304 RepID=UPI002943B87B|nr:LysR substrate-binding domain-containing protein [Palleronia sp. LCG004]WOI58240.1 LysR substrate-binding domain-containing protein [Palleronia sp. LCG004]
MGRPNFRRIEAFNAVMRSGSITRAAEALFVSQPAVSKLVSAFEHSCGFALFTRAHGRLLPTPEARRLFVETENLITGLERVDSITRSIAQAERGEIAVAAFPALSLRFLPREAARMLDTRPEVEMTLLTRNSPDIVSAMLSRSADFGLSLLPTQETSLQCSPFAEFSMVLALPEDHPLSAQDVVDTPQLEGERLISLGRDDQSFRIVGEAFVRAETRVSHRIEVQMADSAIVMVAEGHGIALVPSCSTIGWEDRGVAFRPLAERLTMTVWLYASRWEPMSNLAGHLLSRLRTALAESEAHFYPEPREGGTA